MQKIGRYEVVERLGSGGFATVYLVHDPVLDSRVAAKVLAENWTDKDELRDRFIREAQLLRRIDSDRVVTVHDIGELPSGQPYFVMALMDRGTLDDRLSVSGSPNAYDVANVGAQLAECLAVIHANNLIHRDIKPSNLLIAGGQSEVGAATVAGLLEQSERLVLGDFGLAKDIALQGTVGFTISAGTGGYAAPEQMSPVGLPDRQTDLYAATAVMYRVISGETPPGFDLANETVPFPDHQTWMLGELGRFFHHGMAFRPERRHDSISHWSADLQAVVGVAGVTPGPLSGSIPTIVPSDPATWAPPNPLSVPSTRPPQHQERHQTPHPPTISQPFPPANSGPVGSSGQYPTVSSGQNPVVGSPYGHPNTRDGPSVSYEQIQGRRSFTKWLALAAVLAVAALGALWLFVFAPSGPTVTGPDTIEAGESIEYQADYEGAVQFAWTDWNDETEVRDDTFVVTAVAPGQLRFSVAAVEADGGESASTEQTITIVDAADGPRIEGPAEVPVNTTETYVFTASPGATNPRWIDAEGERQGDVYTVTAKSPGVFRVVLIVTRTDGTDIGTAREITFVE